MGGLVYTALYGRRDKPMDLRVEDPESRFIMWTDGAIPRGWEKGEGAKPHADSRRAAREIKTNPPVDLSKFDWFLWVDASHTPLVKPSEEVPKWLQGRDFAAYLHHGWQCVYKEIEKCIAFGKDRPEALSREARRLEQFEFPRHYGQIATTVLARRVTPFVEEHARQWQAAMGRCIRDQVSFFPIIWALTGGKGSGMDHVSAIGTNAFKNDDFHYQGGH